MSRVESNGAPAHCYLPKKMTCTNSSSQPNVLLPLSIVAAIFIFLRLLPPALSLSGGNGPAAGERSSRSTTFQHLLDQSRNDVLNLLNHPLQLQLATGELPLGSFRRLVAERAGILEGIESAVTISSTTTQKHVHEEMERHTADANEWLDAAEDAGKSIVVPGIQCYTCGGEHLNIDCPNDNAGAGDASPAALALRSVLQTSGPVGAVAVLRSYGFCCSRLLDAMGATVGSEQRPREVSQPYFGWIEAHSERWTELADVCEAEIIDGIAGAGGNHINIDPSSYSLCLSMFYGWIDNEAATTGIRIESNSSSGSGRASKTAMVRLVDALEDLEPGYAAQRDKHSSFLADITGKADAQEKASAAKRKVDAAAAYLAAKKMKNSA